MAVGLGVSVAGEVLDAAGNPFFFQAFEEGGNHSGGHLRILRESTRADDRVFGVGIDIGYRSQIYVKAVFAEILADDLARAKGVLGVTGFADLSHRREFLHGEGAVVADAGYAAAFFVYIEERVSVEGLEILHEGSELGLVLDVMGKEDDAAGRVFGVHFLHLLVDLLQLIGCDFGVGVPFQGYVKSLWTHAEKLAHFFP